MRPTFDRPFKSESGVILGPYEALQASIMWLRESAKMEHVSLLSFNKVNEGKGLPVIPLDQRSQILTAYMLFGKLDACASLGLFDKFLSLYGIPESRREVFSELLSDNSQKFSPFSHDFDEGWLGWVPMGIKYEDVEHLVPAISRALKRVGYKVKNKPFTGEDDGFIISYDIRKDHIPKEFIRENLEGICNNSDGVIRVGRLTTVDTLVRSTVAMMSRSVETGALTLSRDAAGPIWISENYITEPISIMKIVWDELPWFPKPKSFREAYLMRQDERLNSLQTYIQMLHHKLAIGEIADVMEIKKIIADEAQYFKSKSWASKVSGLVTYLGVPLTIADTIMWGGVTGLATAIGGTASQLFADIIDKKKQKHWLSMSNDFHYLS